MIRVWIWILLLAGAPALAQAPQSDFGPNEGRVLKIDKPAGEITIQHGYIPELSMDPMSMVFIVANPELLDRAKKGDRIKFKAGLVGGRFAVIAIDPLKPKRKESP